MGKEGWSDMQGIIWAGTSLVANSDQRVIMGFHAIDCLTLPMFLKVCERRYNIYLYDWHYVSRPH